jgi:hypothetical protein
VQLALALALALALVLVQAQVQVLAQVLAQAREQNRVRVLVSLRQAGSAHRSRLRRKQQAPNRIGRSAYGDEKL